MPEFTYRHGQLHVEDLSLVDLAHQVGTPTLVYSRAALDRQIRAARTVMGPRITDIAFPVGMAPNVNLLKLVASRGVKLACGGSAELFRARRAGVSAKRILSVGLAERDDDLRSALDVGAEAIVVTSESALRTLSQLARQMRKACRALVWVDPLAADGASPPLAGAATRLPGREAVSFGRARRMLQLHAGDQHAHAIGVYVDLDRAASSPGEVDQALDRLWAFVRSARQDGLAISRVHIAGGYRPEPRAAIGQAPPLADLDALAGRLSAWPDALDLEASTADSPPTPDQRSGEGQAPGEASAAPAPSADDGCRMPPVTVETTLSRAAVAAIAVLITRVDSIKLCDRRKYVALDASLHGLTDGVSLDVWPVAVTPRHERDRHADPGQMPGVEWCELLGPGAAVAPRIPAPTCPLPPIAKGDLLAASGAGFHADAGGTLTPDPLEVLVDGREARVIRQRPSFDHLIAGEIEAAPS